MTARSEDYVTRAGTCALPMASASFLESSSAPRKNAETRAWEVAMSYDNAIWKTKNAMTQLSDAPVICVLPKGLFYLVTNLHQVGRFGCRLRGSVHDLIGVDNELSPGLLLHTYYVSLVNSYYIMSFNEADPLANFYRLIAGWAWTDCYSVVPSAEVDSAFARSEQGNRRVTASMRGLIVSLAEDRWPCCGKPSHQPRFLIAGEKSTTM